MILASAIAHEVGHLLLPDGRHSPEGLMRACWTRDDFHRANQGQLRFSNERGGADTPSGRDWAPVESSHGSRAWGDSDRLLEAPVEHESRHRAGQ